MIRSTSAVPDFFHEHGQGSRFIQACLIPGCIHLSYFASQHQPHGIAQYIWGSFLSFRLFPQKLLHAFKKNKTLVSQDDTLIACPHRRCHQPGTPAILPPRVNPPIVRQMHHQHARKPEHPRNLPSLRRTLQYPRSAPLPPPRYRHRQFFPNTALLPAFGLSQPSSTPSYSLGGTSSYFPDNTTIAAPKTTLPHNLGGA